METLKKYWWLFLLVPVVLYMVYVLSKGKSVEDKMKAVRDAKAAKSILKEEPITNGADNTTDQIPQS